MNCFQLDNKARLSYANALNQQKPPNMKTSSGIIFGFILLLIANHFLAEEKVRHEHLITNCEYGKCEMCLTEQKQVTHNGDHFETRQSREYFQ